MQIFGMETSKNGMNATWIPWVELLALVAIGIGVVLARPFGFALPSGWVCPLAGEFALMEIHLAVKGNSPGGPGLANPSLPSSQATRPTWPSSRAASQALRYLSANARFILSWETDSNCQMILHYHHQPIQHGDVTNLDRATLNSLIGHAVADGPHIHTLAGLVSTSPDSSSDCQARTENKAAYTHTDHHHHQHSGGLATTRNTPPP